MKVRRQNAADGLVLVALARVDAVALGAAVGVLCGLVVFMATLVLVLRGGAPVGPFLGLLAQYFIGYSVTPAGSVAGLLYGAAAGFVLGWATGVLRNAVVTVYLRVIGVRSSLQSLSSALDPD